MAKEKKDLTGENTQQGAGDGDNTQGNAAENTQQGTGNGDNTQGNSADTQQGVTGDDKKKPAAKKETAKKQETGNGDTGTSGTAAPEMGNAALKKIGKEALKRNPSMRTVYVTTDGTAFGTKNDAENHAKTLENKGVEEVTE